MKKTGLVLIFMALCLVLSSCGGDRMNDTVTETEGEKVQAESMAETESEIPEPEEKYNSPYDFDSLLSENPDTIGWLDIPGTDMSYPVVQSPDDKKKYLTTAFDGTKERNGTLYTEYTHNLTDFSDPVTVIYGHRIDKGKMFYGLQETFTDNYDSLRELVIYRPSEELHYTVFAAVPFDNRHILYWFDFLDENDYMNFFEEIRNTNSFGANMSTDDFPEYGDRVLILSTCLKGNIEKRYLVMGKLTEVID